MRIGDPLVAEIFFCRFITTEPKRRARARLNLPSSGVCDFGFARELDR